MENFSLILILVIYYPDFNSKIFAILWPNARTLTHLFFCKWCLEASIIFYLGLTFSNNQILLFFLFVNIVILLFSSLCLKKYGFELPNPFTYF